MTNINLRQLLEFTLIALQQLKNQNLKFPVRQDPRMVHELDHRPHRIGPEMAPRERPTDGLTIDRLMEVRDNFMMDQFAYGVAAQYIDEADFIRSRRMTLGEAQMRERRADALDAWMFGQMNEPQRRVSQSVHQRRYQNDEDRWRTFENIHAGPNYVIEMQRAENTREIRRVHRDISTGRIVHIEIFNEITGEFREVREEWRTHEEYVHEDGRHVVQVRENIRTGIVERIIIDAHGEIVHRERGRDMRRSPMPRTDTWDYGFPRMRGRTPEFVDIQTVELSTIVRQLQTMFEDAKRNENEEWYEVTNAGKCCVHLLHENAELKHRVKELEEKLDKNKPPVPQEIKVEVLETKQEKRDRVYREIMQQNRIDNPIKYKQNSKKKRRY